MAHNRTPVLHRTDWIVSSVVNKIIWVPNRTVTSKVTHHPFLSPFSPSWGMLSGFWFEFSRSHCCGCGSQLPNHPSAYLLPDWPAEESHWLPVCITTQAAAILPLTPASPLPFIFAPPPLSLLVLLASSFALQTARPSSLAGAKHWWYPSF